MHSYRRVYSDPGTVGLRLALVGLGSWIVLGMAGYGLCLILGALWGAL